MDNITQKLKDMRERVDQGLHVSAGSIIVALEEINNALIDLDRRVTVLEVVESPKLTEIDNAMAVHIANNAIDHSNVKQHLNRLDQALRTLQLQPFQQ